MNVSSSQRIFVVRMSSRKLFYVFILMSFMIYISTCKLFLIISVVFFCIVYYDPRDISDNCLYHPVSQSSDQQKVHVNWGVGTLHENMSASLHVQVIHASIVLLTCRHPLTGNVSLPTPLFRSSSLIHVIFFIIFHSSFFCLPELSPC